jgi:two-component system LytT family response regulator
VHVVPAASIDYVEAQDDYVAIHAGGKTYLKNQPLSELEGQLDPALFVRVHRSYIVSVGAIRRIEQASKDSHCAVLDGERRIPVSRNGYQKVRELVG